MDVVMNLLQYVAKSPHIKYLLWMEPMAMVVKSQMSFPFEARCPIHGNCISVSQLGHMALRPRYCCTHSAWSTRTSCFIGWP